MLTKQFLTERNFKMQIAQFLANREDEMFSRNMQVAKFEADRSDEEFKRNMQIAQYNMQMEQQETQAIQKQNLALSQAQFNYRKEIDNLEARNSR